jgi:hypothetical protein
VVRPPFFSPLDLVVYMAYRRFFRGSTNHLHSISSIDTRLLGMWWVRPRWVAATSWTSRS